MQHARHRIVVVLARMHDDLTGATRYTRAIDGSQLRKIWTSANDMEEVSDHDGKIGIKGVVPARNAGDTAGVQ